MSGVSKVNKKSNLEKLLFENMFEIDGLQEGGGDRGKQYELKIFNAIAAAKFGGLSLQGLYTTPAGNDSSRADADLVLPVKNTKNKFAGVVGPVNIEAKLNRSAQLGGTSFSVAGSSPEQIKVIKDDSGMDNKIIDSIKKLISKWFVVSGPGSSNSPWDGLFDFIVKKEEELGNPIPKKQFPLNCSKKAWEAAVKAKLNRPLNEKIEANVNIWTSFYNNKNVYYVQFGPDDKPVDPDEDDKPVGGLYCLGGQDPYGLRALGVAVIDKNALSKISGKYTVELRPGAGGSKKGGRRGIGLRAQGRLKFKRNTGLPATQHSIDSTEGVFNLAQAYFNHYTSGKIKGLNLTLWASRENMVAKFNLDKPKMKKTRIKNENAERSNLKNVLRYLLEEENKEEQEIAPEIEVLEINSIEVGAPGGVEDPDNIIAAPEFSPDEEDSPDEEHQESEEIKNYNPEQEQNEDDLNRFSRYSF